MIEQVILSKQKYDELLNKVKEAEKTIKEYNKLIENNSLTNIQISFPNIALQTNDWFDYVSLVPGCFYTHSYPIKVTELEKILSEKFQEYLKQLRGTIKEIEEIPQEKKLRWFKSKF